MITQIKPGQTLYVTGNSTRHIEDELSAAVVLVRQEAQEYRQGILITRLGPGTFTASCDASVPYGVTDGRDTWTSRGPSRGPDVAESVLH